jgi:hypothetical protein
MNTVIFHRLLFIGAFMTFGTLSAGEMDLNRTRDCDSCHIDGLWYAAGEISTNGCFVCNPAYSRDSWTARTDVCEVYGRCYEHGDRHQSGCAKCDTGRSKTSWTVGPGKCVISDICYDSGVSHPLAPGGAICDPALSQTSWTLPGDHCLINDMFMGDGMPHPAGYARCDISVSKTTWTPIEGNIKIIIAALNEAHTGDIGGMTVADCLCNGQAAQAGEPGTWKAFLSGSTRNAREIVPECLQTGIEVGTIEGWPLYDNWTDMLEGSSWFTGAYIYTFDFTKVDEWAVIPNWYDARAWHGSHTNGVYWPNHNCREWTSDSPSDSGACGELDQVYNSHWPDSLICSCDKTLAVVCIKVDPDTPTDVNDNADTGTKPDRYILSQNYPNPFNPSTTIGFNLTQVSDIELHIFNILGQKIVTLVDDRLPAGEHSILWDGRNADGYEAATGIYFYRIRTGERVETRKMLLLK